MLSWISNGLKNESDEPNPQRISSLNGFLWKMKRNHQKIALVPQWNKRWFSIEGKLLKWYPTPSAEKASGMVDLRFITSITKFESSLGVFSFILSYPDRNLLLRAQSLSDMNKWMRALQFQADIVRGGDGTGIVSDVNSSCSNPQGKGRGLKDKYRPATLEANLEATMAKLQVLENQVMKSAGLKAKSKLEKDRETALKNAGGGGVGGGVGVGVGTIANAATESYLTPEDVKIDVYRSTQNSTSNSYKYNDSTKNVNNTYDNDTENYGKLNYGRGGIRQSHSNKSSSDESKYENNTRQKNENNVKISTLIPKTDTKNNRRHRDYDGFQVEIDDEDDVYGHEEYELPRVGNVTNLSSQIRSNTGGIHSHHPHSKMNSTNQSRPSFDNPRRLSLSSYQNEQGIANTENRKQNNGKKRYDP